MGKNCRTNGSRRINRVRSPLNFVKKLVSKNLFDSLISGSAFDLREGPVRQCA